MSNTANSTSVDDDSTDKLQRYRITVPSPKAWFHMGEPSDLGYQGVSLGADDHAFLSVKGSTLTQAKGQVNHVALMEWVQSSGGDMTLNTGGNQMMASKRQIILAAGTGYSPDLQLENGLSVPKAYFNPYDYQDLMEPCRLGVRAFDADMKDAVDNFNDDLGMPADAKPSPAALAAGWKASLLAGLVGTQPPPTENSYTIEMFHREYGGLLGKLDALKSLTDRVERWTSRPDTLPGIGKVIDAGKSLQLAIRGATTIAYQLATLPVTLGIQPGPYGSKGGISSEYGREVGEAQGKAQMISTGKGARNWDDQGVAVSELAGTGFQHLLRPIANRVREVSYALASARGAILAIADLLGLPRPSGLALVGKDGVSIVSPKRVSAYAADGFHFVTCDPKKPIPSPWKWAFLNKITSVADAAANAIEKLFPPTPKPVPQPGFHVRSQGDVDLRSQQDINLWGVGSTSRTRVMARYGAELSATQVVGISSRIGTAEVLGREVTVGSTVERAKGAFAIAGPAAALKQATVQFATLADAANVAAEKVQAKREELRLATEGLTETAFLGDPAKMAKASAARAALVPLDAELLVKDLAKDAGLVARDVAFDAYVLAASIAPPLVSPLAEAMGWKKDGVVQAVAETVQVGAAEKVDLFGSTVSVGATKSVTLQADLVIPNPMMTGKVAVKTDKVEIAVGPDVAIVVTASMISIKVGGQTVFKSDGLTTTIQGGESKITLGPTGISSSSEMLTASAQLVNLG